MVSILILFIIMIIVNDKGILRNNTNGYVSYCIVENFANSYICSYYDLNLARLTILFAKSIKFDLYVLPCN